MEYKIYYDLDGNKCSLLQLIQCDPLWAMSRIREGEKAIAKLAEQQK